MPDSHLASCVHTSLPITPVSRGLGWVVVVVGFGKGRVVVVVGCVVDDVDVEELDVDVDFGTFDVVVVAGRVVLVCNFACVVVVISPEITFETNRLPCVAFPLGEIADAAKMRPSVRKVNDITTTAPSDTRAARHSIPANERNGGNSGRPALGRALERSWGRASSPSVKQNLPYCNPRPRT